MGPGDQRLGVRLDVGVAAPDGAVPATRGLGPWLSGAAPAGARGEVAVAVVSDARMRSLNRVYRGERHATDVLSFPASVVGAERFLGDIVIAAGVAARQARQARHSLRTELRVLALHGLLHLLGYDHETDNGEMARLEARLRRRNRLPDGLLQRNAPGDLTRARTPRGLNSAARKAT